MPDARLDLRGVLVTCASCGRTNRITYPTLGKTARCGNCRTAVSLPGVPIEAPDAHTFQALVATSSLPVVVDFWAPWCSPCRMMAPEVDRVARARAGQWLVVKVNTEALPDVGEHFRIRSIPMMALFLDGREVSREAGARPADAIQAFVARHLGACASRSA
jgi:thioredoxin 2